MNTQRILIAVLWIASLTAAFFLGGGGGGAADRAGQTANAAAGAGAGALSAEDAAKAEAARKVERQFGDTEEIGPNGKRSVKSIIGRARAEMASGMGRMINMRAMLRAFAPIAEIDDAQIPEALAEVEKTVKEPQARMMFYSMLLSQWAEKDGAAAMAYAQEKVTDNNFGMPVNGVVLASWAKSDPEGAWKWYQSQPKDSKSGPMQGGMGNTTMMFAGMAAANLDSALARVETLDPKDPQAKMSALMGIASSVSGDGDRRRLLDRAATMPEDSRKQILNTVVGQWAMSDPDEALKWVRSLPAEQQPAAKESAGNMLMMTKPELGAQLLLESAKPEDKARIYDMVAGRWGYQDPKGAGEWLSKQPQGPELDGARRSLAVASAQRDPASAMNWANSVTDVDQRTESVTQIYATWRGRDPAAAEAAVKKSGLPAEKIQAILTAPAPEPTEGFGAPRPVPARIGR